jgi:hypothetical protein
MSCCACGSTLWGASYNFTNLYILYENVFQNPEIFPTQVSLSPKQSTLTRDQKMTN